MQVVGDFETQIEAQEEADNLDNNNKIENDGSDSVSEQQAVSSFTFLFYANIKV
jgi:hypothetical protein